MKLSQKIKWVLKIFLGKELYFKKQIKCNKIFLGTEYGGYFICPDNISKESIVYSFGVGEDISFDKEMIRQFGCTVCAFDPTPKSIEWLNKQDLPQNFIFFNYGLAQYDGVIKFYPPDNTDHISHTIVYKETTKNKAIEVEVRKLTTLLKLSEHRKIDILKLDIEGAEYEVIEDIINSDIEIEQILIEFHHRFPNLGKIKTKEAVKKLNERGYKIFAFATIEPIYSFIKF